MYLSFCMFLSFRTAQAVVLKMTTPLSPANPSLPRLTQDSVEVLCTTLASCSSQPGTGRGTWRMPGHPSSPTSLHVACKKRDSKRLQGQLDRTLQKCALALREPR